MEQLTLPLTGSVKNAAGKARRVLDAQDVQHLLRLLLHEHPTLFKMVRNQFLNPDFGMWIWGDEGFALVEVHDSPIHGRIASLEWLESDSRFKVKRDVAPLVEDWAREHGAKSIATLVHQHIGNGRLWERLTGWEPIALAIGKEL